MAVEFKKVLQKHLVTVRCMGLSFGYNSTLCDGSLDATHALLVSAELAWWWFHCYPPIRYAGFSLLAPVSTVVQSEDMPTEMAQEATEIITAGVDKFIASDNFEKAAQNIKESLDKKFGPTWHVCVGEVGGVCAAEWVCATMPLLRTLPALRVSALTSHTISAT